MARIEELTSIKIHNRMNFVCIKKRNNFDLQIDQIDNEINIDIFYKLMNLYIIKNFKNIYI